MNGDIVTENIQILPYTYLNKKTKHLKEKRGLYIWQNFINVDTVVT